MVFFNISWAMGESWESRPSPAETLRKSMPHSIHHWGVFFASSKVKDSAAEAPLPAEGLKPAGSQPLGGFLYNWAAAVTKTRKMTPQI